MSAEYICTSEIYQGITLLSASIVDIYMMGSILLSVVESRCAAPLVSEEDTEPAPRVLPGDEPTRVGEFWRRSALCVDAPYERIRPASKVNIKVHLSVCLSQIFVHKFNP